MKNLVLIASTMEEVDYLICKFGIESHLSEYKVGRYSLPVMVWNYDYDGEEYWTHQGLISGGTVTWDSEDYLQRLKVAITVKQYEEENSTPLEKIGKIYNSGDYDEIVMSKIGKILKKEGLIK